MDDAIQFHIDQAGFDKGLKCGTVNFFAGWVVNMNEKNPVDHVSFTVSNVLLGTLPINHDRPDLMNVYHTSLIGFWGAIMIPEEHLRSTLSVDAVASNGMHVHMKEYVLDDVVSLEEKEFTKRYNLPNGMLRQLVVSNIDPYLFIQRGKEGVELMKRLSRKHRINIDSFSNILDFGVGCGRIIRWWEDLSSRITFWGTDINEQLIRWCKENIPFGRFTVNNLHPPTQFEDNTFDLLYAFSIFTHLALNTQSEWLREFSRILAPQRYVIISVHGDADARLLSKESQERYLESGYVTISENAEGENMCATYQNKKISEQLFSEYFDVLDHVPAGRESTSKQDLYLLRKKREWDSK